MKTEMKLKSQQAPPMYLSRKEKYLSRGKLRVLHAVMFLADAVKPITIRAIAGKIGWANTGSVRMVLYQLRDQGLVTFEPRRAGTIRPCVRFVAAEDLERTI